ncbi:hypothetical protein [Longimicrobium sp.]|uniref:hypothetical protein n=1 Tax=Longimicrobium sp. TaxID=2029185 RepID=UPI002ED9E5E4
MAQTPEPLEGLIVEPPAGPTVMRKAHQDAMRKTSAMVKAHLKDPEEVEDFVRATVLSYLAEWSVIYTQGAREAAETTSRVILQIRQDTVQQMTDELRPKD